MDCPVCASSKARILKTRRTTFFRCSFCGFSWVHPDYVPDTAAAEQRYRLHRNDESNEGYRTFLSGIIDRAFYYAGKPASVIDWGSGPNPLASKMIGLTGCSVFSWDPLFSSAVKPLDGAYDLGVCIESAEHFTRPREDFASFFRTLKPGAYALVHTHLAPDDDDAFLRWWYTEDITHVSFYSRFSLALLGAMSSAGLFALEDGKTAVFRKPLPVLVAGGVNWDIEGVPFNQFIPRDSNPGTVKFSPGGTGRNMAENLARLGLAPELVSAAGDDFPGKMVREMTGESGVGISGIECLPGESSSVYLSVLDKEGDMISAVSGMGIFDRVSPELISPALVRAAEAARKKSYLNGSSCPFSLLILDANLPPETLLFIREQFRSVPAWFDPVSTSKAKRAAEYGDGILLRSLDFIKPNLIEAFALAGKAPEHDFPENNGVPGYLYGVLDALASRGINNYCISLGENGVLSYRNGKLLHFKPPVSAIVSATGAGDSFVAGAAWGYLLYPDDRSHDIRAGSAAAALTLSSAKAVSDAMSAEALVMKVLEWEQEGFDVSGGFPR